MLKVHQMRVFSDRGYLLVWNRVKPDRTTTQFWIKFNVRSRSPGDPQQQVIKLNRETERKPGEYLRRVVTVAIDCSEALPDRPAHRLQAGIANVHPAMVRDVAGSYARKSVSWEFHWQLALHR